MSTMTYRMPPRTGGDGAADSAALNEWCRGLMAQLKHLFDTLDILSKDGSGIDASRAPISSPYITISDSGVMVTDGDETLLKADSDGIVIMDGENILMRADHNGIRLMNADDTQFIEVMPNEINIVCHIVECDQVVTPSVVEPQQ